MLRCTHVAIGVCDGAQEAHDAAEESGELLEQLVLRRVQQRRVHYASTQLHQNRSALGAEQQLEEAALRVCSRLPLQKREAAALY